MVLYRWITLVGLLCVFSNLRVMAQSAHTLAGSSDFSRKLDALQWNYGLQYDYTTYNTRIALKNQFQSRLYLIQDKPENIQDEYQGYLKAVQFGKNQWGIQVHSEAFGFSSAKVRQEKITIGPAYRFKPNTFELYPMVGYLFDQRNQIQDRGPMVALAGSWASLMLGDFRLNPQFQLEYASIDPRRYGHFRLQSDGRYEDPNLRFNGLFNLGRSLRDSYQASSFLNRNASNLIETIRTDTSLIQTGLELPLGKGVRGRIDLYALSQKRTFTNRILSDTVQAEIVDTRYLRQDYDLTFQAIIPKNRYLLNPGIRISGIGSNSRLINTESLSNDQVIRRSEILERSNFQQRSTELFADQQYSIDEQTRLQLRLLLGILRYDTPEINADDRDEQTLAFRLVGKHRFSEFFSAGLSVAGEAYHYVYLFSERSAENNWRRSVRVLPEVEWTPTKNITFRQSMFVRANYTVYDFQVPGRLNADQSAREYGIRSRLEIQVMPTWYMESELSRAELRIGRLRWDTFTEIPIDTLVTWEANWMLSKRIQDLKISSGYRLFQKNDFLPQVVSTITVPLSTGGTRTISRIAPGLQSTWQSGPSVQMSLPLSAKNELVLDGWLQRQRTYTKLYTQYPEAYKDAFLAKEKTSQNVRYPNIMVSARFRF